MAKSLEERFKALQTEVLDAIESMQRDLDSMKGDIRTERSRMSSHEYNTHRLPVKKGD